MHGCVTKEDLGYEVVVRLVDPETDAILQTKYVHPHCIELAIQELRCEFPEVLVNA